MFARRAISFVALLFVLAFPVFLGIEGCGEDEGLKKCTTNQDCVGTGSNPYCNLAEGVCRDKGKCENSEECLAWFPDLMVPYCNSQGMCIEKGPCTSDDECTIEGYVCKEDGSCRPGTGVDGDQETTENPQTDGDQEVPDQEPEEPQNCANIAGSYEVSIDCNGEITEGVATIVQLPDSCDITINYPGGTLTGSVDEAGNISTAWDKECNGSVSNNELHLQCTDGCVFSGPQSEISGQIAVDPQELDFGSVLAGDTASLELTITNIGDTPLKIFNITLSSDTHPDFSFELPEGVELPKELSVGGNLVVTVKLSASDNSRKRGNLIIINSSPNAQVIVPLKSDPKGVSIIEVEPEVLDLGAVPPGSTNQSFFYIKNTGDADGIIVNVELTNDANGAFELGQLPDMSPPTFYQIPAHASLSVDVYCHPIEGVHTPPGGGTLPLEGQSVVTYMDPQSGNQYDIQVQLVCTVVEPSPPCIEIDPLDGLESMFPWGGLGQGFPGIRFGLTELHSNDARQLIITNCGDEDLIIHKIETDPPPWPTCMPGVPNPCPPEFLFAPVLPILTPITIPRGGSWTMDVIFSPSVEGVLQSWSIAITSNATTSTVPTIVQAWTVDPNIGQSVWPIGVVHVGLSGKGAVRDIDVLPSKLDFGLITLGCCSRPETVSVYDTGELELVIQEIRMSPNSDPGFEILNVPPLPYTLHGGDVLRFDVRFCAPPQGPEGPYYGTVEIVSNDQNEQIFTVPVQAEATRMVHQVDHFHQNDKPTVDILWVVDCSGSMGEEQDNLANNFDTFIQTAVNWNADIQIGVISCDLESPGHAGRLQGSPKIVKFGGANSMTRDEAIRVFRDNVRLGTNCSGTEKGLEAAHLALSPPLITDPNENAEFLRENAALVIVFVSDEEDQSTSDTSYYIDFFRNIKGYRNVEMLQVYAIVGDCPDGCTGPGGQAEYGCRYVDVSTACGGFFRSICSTDWSAIYRDIGNRAFGLRRQFFLSRLADPDTLVVTVDGQVMEQGVDYVYDEESNSIIFNDPPPAGSDITAEYDTVCLH